MWDVGTDGTGISAYPIIEFITTASGGQFRSCDSNIGDWTDGRRHWCRRYTLNVRLGGGHFNSRVDGDREALIEQFRHEREHRHHLAESVGAISEADASFGKGGPVGFKLDLC